MTPHQTVPDDVARRHDALPAERIVNEPRVRRLVAFFEAISPSDLTDLGRYYTESARFKDPFNEVVGLAAVAQVYRDMFQQLQQPRFQIVDATLQGDCAMLAWQFQASSRLPGLRSLQFPGLSVLRLDAQGRIASHVDYWDAGEHFYAKLPGLGRLVRWVARRAAASHP
jgi:steroid Delta-isomerase